MLRLRTVSLGLLLAGLMLQGLLPRGVAQEKKDAPAANPQTTAATAVANPKDVQSLDAMVRAIYL